MILLLFINKLFLQCYLTKRGNRAEYFEERKKEKKEESFAESSVLTLAEHIGLNNQARCRGVSQDKWPLFNENNGCIVPASWQKTESQN